MKFERVLAAFAFLYAMFLLQGCQTTEQAKVEEPVLTLDIAYEQQPVADESEIFYLPKSAQQKFLAYYNSPQNLTMPGNKRLSTYLENILSGFDYHHGTYTAAAAYQQGYGNCLSLAILTTALAELVDIEVAYRHVHSPPVYKKKGQIMTLSSHVNTRVYDPDFVPEENQIVLIRPHTIVDYFPRQGNVSASGVTHRQFIAKYYQNLAGDALLENNFNLAHSYLARAREVDPNNPETLNTLGVLLRQTGEYEQAEKTYLHILAHTEGSLNTVANYIVLLESMGRTKEAAALQRKFHVVDDDNPYRWFQLGERQFSKGNYQSARKLFQRSIELGPYLNEAYFGLAKSYYMAGNKGRAEDALQSALALTYLPEEKTMYQAKLDALSGY